MRSSPRSNARSSPAARGGVDDSFELRQGGGCGSRPPRDQRAVGRPDLRLVRQRHTVRRGAHRPGAGTTRSPGPPGRTRSRSSRRRTQSRRLRRTDRRAAGARRRSPGSAGRVGTPRTPPRHSRVRTSLGSPRRRSGTSRHGRRRWPRHGLRDEQLAGVFTDRWDARVPRRSVVGLDAIDEMVLDEGGESGRRFTPVPDDRSQRPEGEGPRERTGRMEDRSRPLIEVAVGPVQTVAEAAVPRRCRIPALQATQCEIGDEQLVNRRDAERSRAEGRELDRERQSAEPGHDQAGRFDVGARRATRRATAPA